MAVYSMNGIQENCYPDTTVLINKLGITQQEQLSLAEQRIVTGIYTMLEARTKFQNVDFEFFKLLHKQLFYDLYEWAGSVRTINISKKGTVFCKAEDIERIGTIKFHNLAKQNYLKGMDKTAFLNELAELYHDLNMLHPFREGNGRTLRLFITLLVRNAGYNMNFDKCDPDLLMIATIKAAQGDISMLRNVLENIIEK